MIGWLKKLFLKEQNNTCETCVYWKSEEENNIIPHWNNNKKRYCDVYKYHTKYNHSCAVYTEEKFEAQHNSIQTPELSLDIDTTIERVDLDEPRR